MSTATARRASVGLLLVGGLVATVWVRYAGGSELAASLGRVSLPQAVGMALLTAACIALRFVRWQYLLRGMGVRVPIRPNAVIYLASLAGIATPAYIGEAVRSVLMRRAFAVPVRLTLGAWVTERVLDFAALALIGLAAVAGGIPVLLVLAVLALAGSLLPHPPARRSTDALRPSVMLPSVGLSVLAWLPAALLLPAIASAMGAALPVADGIRVFAAATAGGGVSLMPAGMGATGSLAIVQLESLQWDRVDAVAAVSLFRLATTGLTLAVGAMFLVAVLRGLRRSATPPAHFDDIAHEYLDQFAPHIWDLLLERKTALMCSALPREGRGLDLGCGLGRQALALRKRGYDVVGLDPAFELVRRGAREGLPAVTGSGLELPFADGCLDFVYSVGVLHHLTGPGEQDAAVREIERVLRPGGVLVVHETNPRNPLFRLYMGYVFPILKSIDEGVERWLDPRGWASRAGLSLTRTEYFTFLPDFLPRPLLRPVMPLERMLERSRARIWSVHYMAVLRKQADPKQPAPELAPMAAEAIS